MNLETVGQEKIIDPISTLKISRGKIIEADQNSQWLKKPDLFINYADNNIYFHWYLLVTLISLLA